MNGFMKGSGKVELNQFYKSVLIVGANSPISDDVKELYKKQGYLLIGDGKQSIDSLDLSVLYDKVDENTRIDIFSHGIAHDGVHSIDIRTKDFLEKIASYCGNIPLNIHLHCCYAGAAAPDVSVLPVGSVFVTHGTPEHMTSVDMNSKTIFQSNQDLHIADPVLDLIQRFVLNVKQTATISIKRADGVFQHTIRPPQHMLSNPHEIVRYLEHTRSEFIKAYDLAFATNTPQPPKITIEEAIEWRNDNFFSMVVANDDKRLIEALEDRIEAFADYINYSLGGYTILRTAAGNGYIKLMTTLLKSDHIDANAGDSGGCTALTSAASLGRVGAVYVLVNSGKVDVNARDKSGFTALMLAASLGHAGVITALLRSNNLDVNARDKNGCTALMLAASLGYAGVIIALLRSNNLDVDARDKNGSTALMLAASQGRVDVVSALIISGRVDVNARDKSGSTALMLAASLGHAGVITALLRSNNLDVNARDKNGSTALMLAASQGRVDVVSALIISGRVDVNARDDNGYTDLMLAASQGRVDIVSTLVKFNEVDVEAKDRYGCTALMLAASQGRVDVVSALITSGRVDVNARDNNGNTAAMWADRFGHELVSALLKSASIDDSINGEYDYGYTDLMLAASQGDVDKVSELLASGEVDVNAKDKYGCTALMLAASQGYDEVVTELTTLGKADVSIRDNDGNTAAIWADRFGHELVSALLESLSVNDDISAEDNDVKAKAAPVWADKIGHKVVVPPVALSSSKVANVEAGDKSSKRER